MNTSKENGAKWPWRGSIGVLLAGVTSLGLLSVSGCGLESALNNKYDLCIVIDHSGSTRNNLKLADTIRGVSKTYLSQLKIGPKNALAIRHGGSAKEVIYEKNAKGIPKLRDLLNSLADEKASECSGAERLRQTTGAAGQRDEHGHAVEIGHNKEVGSEEAAHAKEGHHEEGHKEGHDEHHDEHEAEPQKIVWPKYKKHDPKRHVPVIGDPHGKADGLEMGSPIVESMLAPALAWANNRPSKNKKMIVFITDMVHDPTVYKDGCRKDYLDPAKFKWAFKTPENVQMRFYMVDDTTQNNLQPAWEKFEAAGVDIQFFSPGHGVDKEDLNLVE